MGVCGGVPLVSSVVVCGVVSWCVEVCMHEVCGSVPLHCESVEVCMSRATPGFAS